MIREQIMQALLTLVRQTPGFVSVERGLEYWSGDAKKPAIFIDEPTEEIESLGGAFPKITTLIVKLWVYVNIDPLDPPTSALNPLLDAIDQTLKPPFPGGRQTLGGLVYNARIGGDHQSHKEEAAKSPGLEGVPTSAAIVPVRILVP